MPRRKKKSVEESLDPTQRARADWSLPRGFNVRRGWHLPWDSKRKEKAHFFLNGQALCGDRVILETRCLFDPGKFDVPMAEDCRLCTKMHRRRVNYELTGKAYS